MKNETRVQYAPGEWASEYCGKDTIKIFKASDKRRIATIKVKSMILDEANARLIANSPELLDRLEDCVVVLQSLEDMLQGKSYAVTDSLKNARNAINKATKGNTL